MPDGAVPAIRFAQARGARLAYQVFGEGEQTIVSIPPTAQNIEVAWERPEIRHMLERLGSFSRFVHFDKRGTGASGRRTQVNDIDERVDDLRAVMDDAGVERAHFLANSEGGPMSILFAVSYPERVQSLVLFGTGAVLAPPDLEEEQQAELAERHRRFASVWGTADSPVVDGFAPTMAGDQEYRTWHQRYERLSATPESLLELLEMGARTDVREVLERVAVPTLVIHRTGDRVMPIEYGRALAAGIPGAVLFEQPGSDHFGYAGAVDEWIDEVERFVTGAVSGSTAAPARAQVEVVTLGRFAVLRNEVEVELAEWGSRMARQLVKRLVVARGWPVTRDELIEMMWPDETDRRKLGARLSVQLSAVRRILGGGVISTRDSVRLDLGEVRTDLESFFSATDAGAIVAAGTGEFLPDDVFEDWSRAMRDEVRTRFVTAARQNIAQLRKAGASVPAARVARRILDLDRYDDGAHRAVVEALVDAGELGEARLAHQAWVDALAELDLVPPDWSEFV